MRLDLKVSAGELLFKVAFKDDVVFSLRRMSHSDLTLPKA
ncbi:hypothetical protein RB2083_1266 [Rhodobacteraceae bacterium HTCC2083]|nr:hypothetical protein RB2083_1266 [Rhodobacteraceae bacterium HTCC2083]